MKTRWFALIGSVLMVSTGCSDPAVESAEAIDSVSQAYAGQDLIPPPVAHWTFDNCAEGEVPNEGQEWGEANLLNGVTCGAGAFNTAGIFDGVNDRAEVADDLRLHFTNVLTISAWVKPISTTPPQTIVGKWYAPDSYLLWLSNGYYRFSVALADGTYASVALPATANAYAKLVGRFNGQSIELLVSDSTADQVTSATAAGTLRQSDRPVTMGNHPSWNPYKGEIDEVKLYNTTDLEGNNHRMCFTINCNPPSVCCEP
jgi:hypothetical protein